MPWEVHGTGPRVWSQRELVKFRIWASGHVNPAPPGSSLTQNPAALWAHSSSRDTCCQQHDQEEGLGGSRSLPQGTWTAASSQFHTGSECTHILGRIQAVLDSPGDASTQTQLSALVRMPSPGRADGLMPQVSNTVGCGHESKARPQWCSASSKPLVTGIKYEWVAISFCRGSSWPRDRTCVSCIGCGFFTTVRPGKP